MTHFSRRLPEDLTVVRTQNPEENCDFASIPGGRAGGAGGDRRAQGAALLSDCPGPTVTALPPTPVTPKPASSSEMGTTTHPSRRARDEFTHIQHWHHAWDRGHGHRLTCLVRSILVKPFSDTRYTRTRRSRNTVLSEGLSRPVPGLLSPQSYSPDNCSGPVLQSPCPCKSTHLMFRPHGGAPVGGS